MLFSENIIVKNKLKPKKDKQIRFEKYECLHLFECVCNFHFAETEHKYQGEITINIKMPTYVSQLFNESSAKIIKIGENTFPNVFFNSLLLTQLTTEFAYRISK